MVDRFVRGAEASERLGVCQQTLRNWERYGKIDVIRTPGRIRLYNVDKFIRENDWVIEKKAPLEGVHVCYCRVSSHDQKDALDRQIEYMKKNYPDYEIISDIGSGINFDRKGFLKLIDYAIQGKLRTLVISYKDRLCRIGYSLVEHILIKYSQCEIIIDAAPEQEDINVEIAKDVLEIITVYSAKMHGMRRYQK